MLNTQILEQSILMTMINGGMDITNKSLLQKAIIDLSEKDFTEWVDKDLFIILSKVIQEGQIYYSYMLLEHTKDTHVQSRIEYFISLANHGVCFTSLENDIYRLKKFNQFKNATIYLNNINNALKNEADVENLEKLFFDNIQALSQIGDNEKKIKHDLHTLSALNASGHGETVNHFQTTFKKLNEALQNKGIREGSLCVIAGSSGVGKSSFSLFMLDSIASLQPDKQSLFFSLELDKTELMERYLSVLQKKPYSLMNKNEIEQATINAVEKPNILVYDLIDFPDIKYISSIIRYSILASYNKPISVIVIDFIGLVKIDRYRESKAQMLEEIAYQLLSLSKKLGCVIILLQQVNRDYYKRESKDIVPFPQDASDSSGPEKAASLWIGIGRHGEHTGQDPNHFELAIRKNRHGIKDFRISLEFANGTFRQLEPHFQFRKIDKPQDKNFSSLLD